MAGKNWRDIKEYEFQAFEDVKVSGATNMFDVSMVSKLSDYETGIPMINENEVSIIISNYDKLNAKYPEVREKK